MHKYGASLTFNYFNSEALRQSKRLSYSMGNLNLFIEFKSIDRISIYFMARKLKKSFLKGSPHLYMSPSEWHGVIHLISCIYVETTLKAYVKLKSVKTVLSINTRNYSNVLLHTSQKDTRINTGSLSKNSSSA